MPDVTVLYMRKYFFLLFTLSVLAFGMYLGYRLFSPTAKQEHVTKETIVRELQNEGFLITQTYLVNQSVTIDRNSGSVFKDFFWGQDIRATALMKVGSGVNLKSLNPERITVSPTIVRLELPKIEQYSAEVFGEIAIQNQQGVLKKIFNRDDGYNAAYEQLRSGAFQAAADPLLARAAEDGAQLILSSLVRALAGNREVVITFK